MTSKTEPAGPGGSGSATSGTSASATSTASSASGRHWLKYAGIGSKPNTSHEAVRSGDDVTSLGSLEAEILSTLWDIARPATSMEVMEVSLYKRRAQGLEPASFATIATTLRRLTSKGILRSQKNDARTPVYWATVGREQMAARILNNVSQTLLGTSLHGLLPKLIGHSPPRAGNVEGEVEQEEDVQRLMDALEQVARAGVSGAAGEVGSGPKGTT